MGRAAMEDVLALEEEAWLVTGKFPVCAQLRRFRLVPFYTRRFIEKTGLEV
jgi:hypothetical protein